MKHPRSSGAGNQPGNPPRLPPLPPLRITIPLVLLAFAVTVGFLDLQQNSRLASRRVEEDSIQALTQLMGEKQDHLEILLWLREPERVQEEVAGLGADTHVKKALLIDDTGQVFASLRRVEIGRQARVAPPRAVPR